MNYRNPKILKAARGEQCLFHGPTCNGNPETVVAAHSNMLEDGKGKGLKAHDCFVCFACSDCHDWYDRSREAREIKAEFFNRGMKRTWLRLLDLGVLK